MVQVKMLLYHLMSILDEKGSTKRTNGGGDKAQNPPGNCHVCLSQVKKFYLSSIVYSELFGKCPLG